MRKILILAPHPDDEAIATGGLISYLRPLGWDIRVLVFAVGECRQLVTGKTKPGPRMRELKSAERVGGYQAKLVFVGDHFMHLDRLPRKALCDVMENDIEAFKPDVVVVPPASSYDQDHRAVAEAAVTALRPRPDTVRHFVPIVLEADEPYWWRLDGCRPTPNLFIPLTEENLALKARLVCCHASQNRASPFGRSVENLRRYAQIYGIEIGGDYAEAYRVLRLRGDALFRQGS